MKGLEISLLSTPFKTSVIFCTFSSIKLLFRFWRCDWDQDIFLYRSSLCVTLSDVRISELTDIVIRNSHLPRGNLVIQHLNDSRSATNTTAMCRISRCPLPYVSTTPARFINCCAFYEFTKCTVQFINCANSQIAPNTIKLIYLSPYDRNRDYSVLEIVKNCALSG